MKRALLVAAATTLLSSQAFAAVDVAWTDWTSSSGLTTATGVISVGGKDVTVTWSGPRASFVQTSGGIDYWQNGRSGRDASTSAFTSTSAVGNTNIPTDTDIVALWFGGTSTLTFSEAVSGLYFSYVSINGNSYDFSEDFDILSNSGSNIDGNGADAGGYWGSASAVKVGTSLQSGGEAHGTIYFDSPLTTLTWTHRAENWNGFTVGIAGVADEVPLPAAALLFAPALGFLARKRRS